MTKQEMIKILDQWLKEHCCDGSSAYARRQEAKNLMSLLEDKGLTPPRVSSGVYYEGCPQCGLGFEWEE